VVEAPEASELPVLKAGVHRETLTMPDGGKLRCTFSIPTYYNPQSPLALAVALHYGGDVKPFLGGEMLEGLAAQGLNDLSCILIAPDSLGGDWTTAQNEKAVVWLTRSVMKSYAIDRKRVLVTGFSMGGQGAWFLGGRHQDLFTAVMPVAAPVAAGTLDWKIPAYVIHSEIDEIVPFGPVKRQVNDLKKKGANIHLKAINNLTHYQTRKYETPMQLGVVWMKNQLKW
jgi:predicted peptidase